jgi:hypothetical protein
MARWEAQGAEAAGPRTSHPRTFPLPLTLSDRLGPFTFELCSEYMLAPFRVAEEGERRREDGNWLLIARMASPSCRGEKRGRASLPCRPRRSPYVYASLCLVAIAILSIASSPPVQGTYE